MKMGRRSSRLNVYATGVAAVLLHWQCQSQRCQYPAAVAALSSSSAWSLTVTSTVPSTSQTTVSELVSGDTPWNALIGDADRAFKYAIALDKNGRARAAAGAFHEAATLYQCFLDSPTEFGHVTALQQAQECRQILAYAALSLGYLNLDVLQSPQAAARLYHQATKMDPFPTAVGFDGMGQSLEAAGRPLEEAIQAYRQALTIQPDAPKAQFHLAVALDRLRKNLEEDPHAREANQLLEGLRREEALHACLVDSWGYVRWHTRKIQAASPSRNNLYRGTRDMLELALTEAQPLIQQGGLVCEFGVGSGRSLRMTQEILPLDQPLHGFDTFTGLPQPWGLKPKGTYSTGGHVPVMDECRTNANKGGESNVVFHKGLFRDTIPPFLIQHPSDRAVLAYAAIDCRLYKSTLDILESMQARIVPGTILAFSEYMGHPTWRQDEFRAWRECCKRFGWKYEYRAFSLSKRMAVVRVTSA